MVIRSLAVHQIFANLNKKPNSMSTLNLSRPKVLTSSSCADFQNDATIATLSTVDRFDPRHSEDLVTKFRVVPGATR